MNIPSWVTDILQSFQGRQTPFFEVNVSEALHAARKERGELSEEDQRGFLTEWSAFMFGERRGKDTVWETYFSPMMTTTGPDGTQFHSPNVAEFDSSTIKYWETRAIECPNPVMRARYADLIWEFKKKVTWEKPSADYARIAIEAYVDSVDKNFWEMEMTGIQWLERALDLAQSINDAHRLMVLKDKMFEFYDQVADTKFPGTWVFLFDDVYGKQFITSTEESRIIENLENMLSKASAPTRSEDGVYLTLDPWAAKAASERLARHYEKKSDKINVIRVTKAYGEAFSLMAKDAGPMMATAWLEPVIEDYS